MQNTVKPLGKRKYSFVFLFVLIIALVSISFGTIGYTAFNPSNETSAEPQDAAGIFQISRILKKINFFAAPAPLSPSSPSAIFLVNNNGDSRDATLGDGICADANGNCTLRAAVQEANTTLGVDTISFNFTAPTVIQLSTSVSPNGLTISEAVNINGTGARLLTVSGNSGTGTGVFEISSSVTSNTEIRNLTVANSGGYGIKNDGRLNLSDVTIRNNNLGIQNSGRLNVTRSTINNNTNGGGILLTASSIVNISNTTITSNQSTAGGGGIYTLSGDVTLNNVTVSHNSAGTRGGGIYNEGSTARIYVRNTIIANNTATQSDPDIYATNSPAGNFVSRGSNFIGISPTNFGFSNGSNFDQVGTTSALNPRLTNLQNNGGQTDTRALDSTSTAKDAGDACVNNGTCTNNPPSALLLTDQRGTDFPRFFESKVDIGAFESFYPAPQMSSLEPNNYGAGRGEFDLIVNGNNFVTGSVVRWKGQDRATQLISNTQLKARILANDVLLPTVARITVFNPGPGGGVTDPGIDFTVAACSYSIAQPSQTVQAAGGNSSVNLTTQFGCPWTVSSSVNWITFPNGNSGSGPGAVQFTVAANSGPARQGIITINGQNHTVNQNNGCDFTLTPPNSPNLAPAASSSNTVNVTATNQSCTWTATVAANSPWITINSGASGTGNGTVTYSVGQNTGPPRTGAMIIGGKTFTVTQNSGCQFIIDPPSKQFVPAGGSGIVTVTASNQACTWNVTSNASWLILNSSANGTGNGSITYTVQINNGPQRTGTMTIAGQTFTVTQENGCTYILNPTNKPAAASGGNDSFQVQPSSPACSWTAVSNVPWITNVTASGTGNSSVTYNVAANVGNARNGTITVSGQTFTVNQANGCSFTIAPESSPQIPSTGGNSNSVAVTASHSECAWTATVAANSSWITINSGASGTGNGTVNYAVQANQGPPRTGTITIGGKTHTVNQANGCSYSVAPATKDFIAAGGTSSFTVTPSNSSCTWTATTTANWITNVTASGTGAGTVSYSVSANTGPARSAIITVNGQTHTVNQANGCVYNINPEISPTIPFGGSNSNSVAITTTDTGCQWTAVVAANSSWITLTSAATGSGNGTITYSVGANNGAARTGTITIAGKTHTVNQANGCTYALVPTQTQVPAAGITNQTAAVNPSNSNCTWTATTNVSWITINGGSNGQGNGTITFSVAANPSPARTGKILINGQELFTVNQDNGCTYSLTPTNATVSKVNGAGSFTVNTGAGCAWTAAVDANSTWIQITGGTPGTGQGTVNYVYQTNNSIPRQGKIIVSYQGGQREFTLNQENGCTYTLNPTQKQFPTSAASDSFSVTTSDTRCTWKAELENISNTWVTVIGSGTVRTGDGTVQFSITANTGPERQARIKVEDKFFTIIQVNGCQYRLVPTELFINEAGGARSFNVETNTGCLWSAAVNSANPWITISSGANGNGTAPVNLSIEQFTGQERSGTLVVTPIGGPTPLTFTVRQFNLMVTNLNDDGVGSLRSAIRNAGRMLGNNTIRFQASLFNPNQPIQSLTLTTGELPINNSSFTIKGPGAHLLQISGNSLSRHFYVNNSQVAIEDLTLINGNGNGAGSDNVNRYGGSIYVNSGTLTLNRVNLVNNNATPFPAPGSRGLGGAIYVHGLAANSVTVNNSTFFLNKAGFGGGIYALAKLTAVNSTFFNNTADGESGGGGIHSSAETLLRNITVTRNSVSHPSGKGAGISIVGGFFEFQNSIVSENNGKELTVEAGETYSLGNNLVGDMPGDADDTLNQIPYLPSDKRDIAPKLSVLSDKYGGTVPTIALFADSPAINSGSNTNAPQTDQRGLPRPVGGTVDIGAFEHNINVNPATLPNAILGVYYSTNVAGSRINGTNQTELFKFEILSGILPPDLSLSEGGLLQGTVVSGGTYEFILIATGEDGMAGVRKHVMTVGGCSYDINPTQQTVAPSGGTGSFSVTAGAGCQWTSRTNQAQWITINNPAPTTGNGTVNFSVAPHIGNTPRTGTITVADKTFTITQNSCTFELSPGSASVSAAGGTGSFNVTTQTGCQWSAGAPNHPWISNNPVSGAGSGTVNYTVQRNNSSEARQGAISVNSQINFAINQAGSNSPFARPAFDFDGDGKADIAVFRPSNATWYLQNSTTGFRAAQFGITSDKVAPADFDGDGKADISVFRDGNWYYLQSTDGAFRAVQFGQAGDVPMPADYDGDQKADVAVYRGGVWYIQGSTAGFRAVNFGLPADVPVQADYDGDGKADVAVFRSGNWYWLQSSNNEFKAIQFGISTDKPVVGDYDGDGKADQAVYRDGAWYVNQSTAGFAAYNFGLATDAPAPADFDGDSKTDLAVFRDGIWYLQRSTSNFGSFPFGTTNDKPISGAFIP